MDGILSKRPLDLCKWSPTKTQAGAFSKNMKLELYWKIDTLHFGCIIHGIVIFDRADLVHLS